MVAPLRIDHHGWQLALMMVMVSGLVMRRRAAGGAVSGLALGLSLAIGIELLPYLGLTAAITSLFWVADRAEAPRMAAFGAASAGAAALSLMLFIPPDARWLGLRDALSLARSEEHTSELPSLMRNSYAVFCLKKKKQYINTTDQ